MALFSVPRGYMRPFLFGSNQENGIKKVCSKLNLEDLLLESSNLTRNFLVYFLVYTKNSWFKQEVLG